MSDRRQLILASTSPRRRELLGRLGVPFEAIDPGAEEPPPPPDETDGIAHARRMAEFKAEAAVQSLLVEHNGGWPPTTTDILASDTIVQLGDEILGKPVDRADAIRILTALSGSVHIVASSVCLRTIPPAGSDEPGETTTTADVTTITFRELSAEEIAAYVDSGESFGKAGAYAVQERGDRFVANIDGEFTTVVGLPLPLVADWLETRGYPVRRP